MKKVIILVLSFFAGIAFYSCKKTSTSEPGPPTIKFMDLHVISETEADFHFGFSDPDGDIGLKSGDTTGVFAFGSIYHYDFHMRLQIKNVQGNWSDTTIFNPSPPPGHIDSLDFLDRIPYIDTGSKDKSLNGEIFIKLPGYRFSSTIKKFRYVFYIYDRAQHRSNIVTTPEFNFP